MKMTIMLATNCIKMYWNGFGTAIAISNTVMTCIVNVKPALKNVIIIMVNITTGIIRMKEG